jgi:ribonuclease HI
MTEEQVELQEELKEVTIFTDGGCDPNPGPGGYGVILIYGKVNRELSGGFRLTTNNRMEIFAAIAGLEALKFPCKVKLYSDSRYLVDAMTQGWVENWQRNDWWRTKKKKAANTDLWKRLLALCEQHQVEFEWVRGHAGLGANERCDELAMATLKQSNLPADEGYEQQRPEDEGGPVKITREGQPCRKCSTPVIKKTPRRKHKPGQTYYYEYYFYCTGCGTMYMVEEAKRSIEEPRLL